MQEKRVAILGGGNMGSAIARGIYQNEASLSITSAQIIIAEVDRSKHQELRRNNQCTVVGTAKEAVAQLASSGIVVIAVKPQMFEGLAKDIAGQVGARLVLSIMAGCDTQRIRKGLGPQARIIRAMPNLPIIHGQGMTAACKGPGASDADLSFVMKLFGRLGHCIKLDESLMDAMTAVASSGSAYVFYLAEAMIRGALAVGFDAKAADQIVRQTIAGAAAMLAADPSGPVQMRAAVTSRGGTTAAATQVLDEARVIEAFSRAIIAARDRGRELSK